MASSESYLEFITDQLSSLDGITHKPMMGEFIIYYQGKIVGGIYDDRFLVKQTPAAKRLMPDAAFETPYEGAKEMLLVDRVDDRNFLEALLTEMLPELPEPTCDWSLFEQAELPAPEVRHYVSDAGDNLYVRNLYETRRMQYTLYNALGRTQEAWRDGKPLAKVYLTIPAEYEAYTPVFWPWRAVELEKKAAAVPRGRFFAEAWDLYVDGQFMQTQYYIYVG